MNFEILKHQIEAATKKAFLEMFEKHGVDKIYGFALYSDEGAMTVCPSTNTLKHLTTVDQEDLDYYKYEPAEWKYEMQGADNEFNEISKQLREELDKNDDDDDWFSDFQNQLYAICIEVLEKLKNENFFQKIIGKDIFLNFTVSDYEFEKSEVKEIISRLNDNEYKTEYLEWLETWEE